MRLLAVKITANNFLWIKLKKNKFGIKCYKCYNIKMMVHYSSRTKLYEGGAKNPLKGIPMKLLVYARNASFVCE